jgi:hypothetical protein
MKYAELKEIQDRAQAEGRRVEMTVRITAGDESHPLHGHLGQITSLYAPLPAKIPLTVSDLHGPDGLVYFDLAAIERGAFDYPFAWPDGRVMVYLGAQPWPEDDEDYVPPEKCLNPGGRRWMHPYVVLSPADIEPA